MTLQPVILCGGSGTRLWPLSRKGYPKQFISFFGKNSLLQDAFFRVKGLKSAGGLAKNTVIVCNEEYRFLAVEQLREAGCQNLTTILEPIARNTAPALTLAALAAMKDAGKDDPIMLVMPADHVVSDVSAFHTAILDGLPMAEQGGVVTFGITPTAPATGFGYLDLGDAVKGSPVRALRTFVEKPNAAKAAEFLKAGHYMWNSGIFMLKASVWLKAIKHFNAAMLNACQSAFDKAEIDRDFTRVNADAFKQSPSDSIDYAVMEKLAKTPDLGINTYAVPLAAGWSDVGAWDAVWEQSTRDEAANALRGNAIAEDTRGSLIFAQERLVACIGCDDLIVVDTPDAVLILNKNKSQQTKELVEELKKQANAVAEAHRKVYRPWGYYDSIEEGHRFKVKRIVVKPGASLSLQMHHHRAEHWIVVCGTARVTKGGESFMLSENQSTFIPLGEHHRLENPGKVDLEMIEVQSGSYLGEDDIVRMQDVYGRTDEKKAAE